MGISALYKIFVTSDVEQFQGIEKEENAAFVLKHGVV